MLPVDEQTLHPAASDRANCPSSQPESWPSSHRLPDQEQHSQCVRLLACNPIRANFDLQSVVLSPKVSHEFIINYESGASYYVLPPAWRPAIATQEGLLQELTARLQQTVSMNAANSAAIMRNAAVNASRIAATSALAYGAALEAGFACQSSGNF
jgi:hypothetical protein